MKTKEKSLVDPKATVQDKVEKDLVAGVKALQKQVAKLPEKIETNDQQVAVAAATNLAKRRIKDVKEFFEPMESKAKALVAEITTRRKMMSAGYEEIERWGNQTLVAYALECQRRDRELLAAANAEHQKEAEKTAEALRNAGMEDMADSVVEAAEATAVTLVPIREKVEGLSMRESYDFTLVDESKLKRTFLMANEKAIRATVKSLGEGAVKVIGEGSIRVVKTMVPVHRTAGR